MLPAGAGLQRFESVAGYPPRLKIALSRPGLIYGIDLYGIDLAHTRRCGTVRPSLEHPHVTSSSSSGFGRKGRSADYDLRGSAARKLAVESLRNIANVSVSDAGSDVVGPDSDPEVAAIVGLLRGARKPLYVAEVAERLQWDSDRAANALARGGDSGVLAFSKDGDTTMVALTKP
jgi:hypothetical protein